MRERGIQTLVRFFGKATATEVARRRARPTSSPATTCWRTCPTSTTSSAASRSCSRTPASSRSSFRISCGSSRPATSTPSTTSTIPICRCSPVERLFARHGLAVFDVEELTTHGGSLRIFAGHDGKVPAPPSGSAFRAREAAAGLDDLAAYAAFAGKVRHAKRALLSCLIELKEEGATHRRLRRGGQGQHAAELLRHPRRLHRLRRRCEPAQAGPAAAGHGASPSMRRSASSRRSPTTC